MRQRETRRVACSVYSERERDPQVRPEAELAVARVLPGNGCVNWNARSRCTRPPRRSSRPGCTIQWVETAPSLLSMVGPRSPGTRPRAAALRLATRTSCPCCPHTIVGPGSQLKSAHTEHKNTRGREAVHHRLASLGFAPVKKPPRRTTASPGSRYSHREVISQTGSTLVHFLVRFLKIGSNE